MPNQQPIITSENGQRQFACSPAAVVVFVINEQEEILFGFHNRRQRWEVVSGALEAEETLLEGALRELAEEMGAEMQVRPLGVIHANTFRYDDNAHFMISVCYLMAYEGGAIIPGDDMASDDVADAPTDKIQGDPAIDGIGNQAGYQWVGLDDLLSGRVPVGIPRERWLLTRAVEMYRMLKNQDVDLR